MFVFCHYFFSVLSQDVLVSPEYTQPLRRSYGGAVAKIKGALILSLPEYCCCVRSGYEDDNSENSGSKIICCSSSVGIDINSGRK